jgi:Flp pilus assembly protein TadG
MRRLLNLFRRDQRGAAAVELALALPILVGVLVFGFDGWMAVRQSANMQTAVQTGLRYYQSGAGDDVIAQRVAYQAWPDKPDDAVLTVGRICRCGTTAWACTELCPNDDPPTVFIQARAQSTFVGATRTQELEQEQVIRVR